MFFKRENSPNQEGNVKMSPVDVLRQTFIEKPKVSNSVGFGYPKGKVSVSGIDFKGLRPKQFTVGTGVPSAQEMIKVLSPDSSNIRRLPWFPSMSTEDLSGYAAKGYEYTWNGMNFVTVSVLTCASIVAVQSPVHTILMSLTKNHTMLPKYSGGALGLGKVLYRGTSSALTGSVVRTSYVTGAREAKPIEEKQLIKVGYIMGVSFGELAVTQISESLSKLKKAGLIPENFNWKTPGNALQLMKAGFGPRYMSGLVNMGSLCVISDKVAAVLPLENKNIAASLGGAGSGMIAAVFSYPFALYKDYTLIQSEFKNGKLSSASNMAVVKQLLEKLEKDPKAALRSFTKNAVKQIPLRMALTGLIFAIVAGLGETLGKEPLSAVVPALEPKKAKTAGIAFFDSKSELKTLSEDTKESSVKPKL